MYKTKYLVGIVTVGAMLALALPAFAQDNAPHTSVLGRVRMMPGVFGTVSAVNGTTLTVTSTMVRKGSTATTYTVDASSATVTKAGASSSVSNIAVGDTVMIQGTVNGTTITAKVIRDGMPSRPTPSPIIQGNGEPVVAGSVTVVSGTTITITNASNITYMIDASNAKVQKGAASASVSSVAVGDRVVVQGTVNGTSVVAASIIDQGAASTAQAHPGLFGGIGSFFKHLFGF